jgi:acyl-lipid (8-3)-desaturase
MTADAKNNNTTYTWEEVAKHNTPDSVWVYSGKTVYDITDWLEKHPGGRDVLLLAAGRDITDLFKSYHPFSKTAATVLERYAIGKVSSTEFPQYKPDSGFYAEVCDRVGKYFKKTGKDYKDPTQSLVYFAIFLTLAYFMFMTAYDQSRSWMIRMLAAAAYGVLQALPQLHIMHDCSHSAMSHKPWAWKIFGRLSLDWFGGSSISSWHNQHVVGHHIYTNVLGADPDLPQTEEGDIRRVTTLQRWASMYKFQYLYLLVLYGVLSLKSRIQDISGKFICALSIIGYFLCFFFLQLFIYVFYFQPIFLWLLRSHRPAYSVTSVIFHDL